MPIQKDNERLTFALERPGAISDGGEYTGSIQLQNVKPVFNVPNLTAHYRHGVSWGYVQIGVIAKSIKWEDVSNSPVQNLSGSAFAWGGNVSTVINASKNITLKLQGVYGKGISNYIADSGVDIAPESNPGSTSQPIKGTALPVLGFFSFAEIKWNKLLSSTVGYSSTIYENSDLQLASAFKKGQYGLVNLRYSPVDNVLLGIEYQYGRRNNFSDGFHSKGNKLQLSFKFNFSKKITEE